MNLIFTGLLIILSLIGIKKTIIKTRKKTTEDERTEMIGLKACQATYLVFTTTLAISSFLLIFFGQYGRVPSDYIYHLGIITSYLTCLNLILYLIFYAYFNKKS